VGHPNRPTKLYGCNILTHYADAAATPRIAANRERDRTEDYARIILRTSPYGSASIRLCTSNIIVERVCAS
jgi:hypothetical protein